MSKTLNEWRDKRVFSLDPGKVRTYSVSGDCSLALRKDDEAWLGPKNTPVDFGAAAKLVSNFADLKAVDFTEGTLAQFGLDEPLRTITAEITDGTQATLLLGSDANAFQQYAKTDDADTIYIIEKHILGMLSPTMEALNTPEPEEKVPAEAPSATSH
jgi:hypothetical protein